MSGLLGGLSTREFLAEYWQRKPLLIRQAIPGFQSPLTAEELAGLALEPDIESRLIRQTGMEFQRNNGGGDDGMSGWDLRHGPFTGQDFNALPETHWTLLLQDMEKFLPDLTGILDRFRFLPDWRIDDLMISHAAPGGSVGPHRDNYDVFLLQAHGRRQWMIDTRPDVVHAERRDTPMRLLARFQATHSWVLEPGDMLYLPPGVPHHGIAQDACQTWSIGFRAPRVPDMLADMLGRVVEGQEALYAQEGMAFLQDRGRAEPDHPAVLDQDTLLRIRGLVRAALQVDDSQIDRWFASHVTEPKAAFADKDREPPMSLSELQQRLAAGQTVFRNPASRIILLEHTEQCWLYLDGQEWALDGDGPAMMKLLTAARLMPPEALRVLCANPANVTLLHELINAGHWFFEDELVNDDDDDEDGEDAP